MYFLFAILMHSTSAFAQTFYLGAHTGFTDTSGPQTDKEAQFSYGGRFGWLFYEHVAFGVEAHYYQANQTTESIGYLPLLAEVTFYPFRTPLEGTSFFVSGQFGATQLFFNRGTQKGKETQTTLGFSGGYLVRIEPRYSLGPELQYLFVFDNDTYAIWSALLSLRVWF